MTLPAAAPHTITGQDASTPPPPVRAGRAETVRFVATHTLPAFARGLVSLRHPVVSLYAKVRQPAWSNATLRAMKQRHGGAPVLVRGLSGDMLVLFDAQDVRRFFDEPVMALAMDPPDKYDSLSVFEPTGVICSRGARREERRDLNDEVLAWRDPVHPDCADYLRIVEEECRALTTSGTLAFPAVLRAVSRVSRRIVLGDRAADDEELAQWLAILRGRANWMGKVRARDSRALYEKATARIAQYAADAPAHALAARALAAPSPEGTDPVGQTHHWLLATDACTAAVVARTLLLLGAHPAEQEAAHEDARTGGPGFPRLRACVQESIRLFPVVPDLVRVTREETEWRGVRQPAGTAVMVPIGFHQRDPDAVAGAHLFAPGRWLKPDADRDTAMAPFSHGQGRCPGDQLGLLLSSAVCAEVLRDHRITGARPVLDTARPLPGVLGTAAVRLRLAPR
ncbi:cytochrome P450 [Streptomyces sp. NBC_00237]|uniref:cytochrome P450 n=1 Tax=Streptomyces sp. NBC_00237 TaxID=2975687 RepID=UPI002253C18E|nr:cytochrome P450 [Streptomyces sp. NBC_00237]MCX5202764.1 cytochrome P450 [Streptomyces sp. NBC_00237]